MGSVYIIYDSILNSSVFIKILIVLLLFDIIAIVIIVWLIIITLSSTHRV